MRDHPLGRSLLEAVSGLAGLSVGDLMASLDRGQLVSKAWSGGGGGSMRRLQVLPDVLGGTGAAKVVYPSGLFRRLRCFAIKRVVASAGAWRPGAYLLLDTPRGMLRLQPHGAEEYGRWLLALNALLQGSGDSAQPALELPWSDAVLLTL